MVESLLAARKEFDDDILVSYSDILFSEEMLQGMIKAPGDFLCAVDRDWQEYWQARYGRMDFDTESLSVDGERNIVSLGLEPPFGGNQRPVCGTAEVLRRGLKVIQDIMEQAHKLGENVPWQQSGRPVKKAYMTDLLQAIIQAGEKVRFVPFHHGWVEFDTNEDYETACQWAEDGMLKRFVRLL